MLKIKRIRSYRIPRYPAGQFEPWKQPAGVAMVKRGVSSAALLLLLDSCIGAGLHGKPIIVWITEADARAAIDSVFARNGIQLAPDVPHDVVLSSKKSAHVVLDGYNDSLSVGYEWVTAADRKSFSDKVWNQLDSDAANSGPYVKAVRETTSPDQLARIMQDFIDTLKAHGTI
jgi:hypothetical protein